MDLPIREVWKRTCKHFPTQVCSLQWYCGGQRGSLRRILRMLLYLFFCFWQVTAGGRYICKLKDGSIIGEASRDPLHTVLWS